MDALHSLPRKPGVKIVQILGEIVNPAAEAHAVRLISRMAQLVKGAAVYLPVSGILATEATRDTLIADDVAQQAISLFDHVTTALVGIGAIEPSPLLAEGCEISTLVRVDIVSAILDHYYSIDGTTAPLPVDDSQTLTKLFTGTYRPLQADTTTFGKSMYFFSQLVEVTATDGDYLSVVSTGVDTTRSNSGHTDPRGHAFRTT